MVETSLVPTVAAPLVDTVEGSVPGEPSEACDRISRSLLALGAEPVEGESLTWSLPGSRVRLSLTHSVDAQLRSSSSHTQVRFEIESGPGLTNEERKGRWIARWIERAFLLALIGVNHFWAGHSVWTRVAFFATCGVGILSASRWANSRLALSAQRRLSRKLEAVLREVSANNRLPASDGPANRLAAVESPKVSE